VTERGDLARARGLALALAECRDDAPLAGVREIGAEIAGLLASVMTEQLTRLAVRDVKAWAVEHYTPEEQR
jgi:hypothetical protein